MSTRDAYHHGHLREALVEAAIKLAAEHGPAGLVLRAVTREVGVSPNAAYRHFADRDALLAEVALRAMRGLVDAMAARSGAVPTDGDPQQRAIERLEAIGRGYVDFALAQPGLFRVCFAAPPEVALAQHGPGIPQPDPAADPFGVLNRALDDLVEVGYMPAERRPGAEVLCWSVVHGFATLHLDGPLAGTPADERERALTAALVHVSFALAG